MKSKKVTKLSDKSWRVRNLYSIVDKNANSIKFKRNRAQEHYSRHKAERNIILKSRQLGFTTDECIDMLDDTLFSEHFSALFVADTKDNAIEIFDKKIKFAYDSIHPDLKRMSWNLAQDTSQKLKVQFEDGIFSTIIVRNSGRAGTYNRLHVSEFGKLCKHFPDRATEIITGTIPAVPLGGRIDIESTAEGVGGHFYDIFWEAWERGEPRYETEFKAHFYNWTWDDDEMAKIKKMIPTKEMDEGEKFADYQKLHNLTDLEITYYYLKWISLKKDWDKLNQEYPTTPQEAFIASGTPYFYAKKIQEYLVRAPKPTFVGEFTINEDKSLNLIKRDDGGLKIWEMPNRSKSYVIGSDVAEGKENGDWSVAQVLDNETGRCVAKLKMHCDPGEWSKYLFALGKMYNWAYMAVEVNKDGLWVNTNLADAEYPNLHFREKIDDIAKTVSRQYGFKTDERTRPYILANLKNNLTENEDIWTNADFLGECLTFVRNADGRPEAASGRHDDEVMSMAIAYEVRTNAPAKLPEEKQELPANTQMVLKRLAELKKTKYNRNY